MAEVRNIKMTVSGVYAQVRRGADDWQDAMLNRMLPRWDYLTSGSYVEIDPDHWRELLAADVIDDHDFGDMDDAELSPAQTDVRIVDVGTLVEFAHDSRGITIEKSGGVPVQTVVGAVDFLAPLRDLADALLKAWCEGYDGDPRENELHVEVSRDGETETIYA